MEQPRRAGISARSPTGRPLELLGTDRAKGLRRMGFRSLRDVTDSTLLRTARLLAAVAQGSIPPPQLDGLVQEEFVGRDAAQALSWPVTALREVGENEVRTLAAIGVKTIGDVAQLAREADEAIMAALEGNGFRERPSAPAQLLPGMIGSVASSIRFTTFIRDVELRKLHFKIDKDCLVPLPISSNPKNPSSLADIFTKQKCPVVHLGYMCDHRQRWINLGTHLGEVVHSLSLAPGESRNIAFVNWRRRQATALEERTTSGERVTAVFAQNRALEEITSAVAREHQSGQTQTEANTAATSASLVGASAAMAGLAGGVTGAVIGGLIGSVVPAAGTAIGAVAGGAVGAAVGGAAGVAAGGLVYSGSQALGMIEADTEGDREIVAEVQQRISLSTSQTASAVRSFWSTAVVEDTQSERVEATTSNITNYNHMHALNLEYYEVLQHYLARIDLERVQPILFLPFTFFDFTDFRFIRDYWEAIRPHIEDEGLQAQGDSYFVTEAKPAAPDLLPVPPAPAPPPDPEPLKLRSLVVDVLFNSFPANTNVNFALLRGTQEVHGSEAENGVQASRLDGYGFGNRYTFDEIEDAQDITGVSLSRGQLVPGDMQFRIRVASGRLRNGSRQLANLQGDVIAANGTVPKDAPTNRVISWLPTREFATDNARAIEEYDRARRERAVAIAKNLSRQAAFEALVESLDRFRERLRRLVLRRRHFFTRVILNAIEPEEIIQLLEALKIGHADTANPDFGIPLSAIAHTIPLGLTSGAFVLKLKRLDKEAVRKLGQVLRIDVEVEELVTLFQYSVATLSFFKADERKEAMAQTDHVYVPTGGLFAEAILGRANGAEYLDMERYFNWQDSPIPHQPPALLPVGTESRFQRGDVSVNVPEGNLQIINPVTLPDPTGLQGVLGAVQNGNIFRDMSKATELSGMVSSLSALAGQLGTAASTLTGQAAQQGLQAATEIGKAAGNLGQSLLTSALSQAGDTSRNLTAGGAALNQAAKLEAPVNGAAPPSAQPGANPAPNPAPPPGTRAPRSRSSTSEDIVRNAAGLPLRVEDRAAQIRDALFNFLFHDINGVPIDGRFDITLRKDGITVDGQTLTREHPFVRTDVEVLDGFHSEEVTLENVPGPLIISIRGEPVLGSGVGKIFSRVEAIGLPRSFTTYTFNVDMVFETIEITATSETEARDALTGAVELTIGDDTEEQPADGRRKPKASKKPKLPTSVLGALSALIGISLKLSAGGSDSDTTTASEQKKFECRVPTGALEISLDQRPEVSG